MAVRWDGSRDGVMLAAGCGRAIRGRWALPTLGNGWKGARSGNARNVWELPDKVVAEEGRRVVSLITIAVNRRLPRRWSKERSGSRGGIVIGEYGLRWNDDLELGLTKDEGILSGRGHDRSGFRLLPILYGTHKPGGFRLRFLFPPEDPAGEEPNGDFSDWDNPPNGTEQRDVDHPRHEKNRIASGGNEGERNGISAYQNRWCLPKYRDGERSRVTSPFTHPQDGDREEEDGVGELSQNNWFSRTMNLIRTGPRTG